MHPQKNRKDKITHLNAVLSSIRDVSRLIIKEKQPEALIQGVCQSLVRNRGFHNAWILLTDDHHRIITSAEAGLGDEFDKIRNDVAQGICPRCYEAVMYCSGFMVTENPLSECPNCPVSGRYEGRGAMSARLSHDGKIYGIITVSVPTAYSKDPEEQELFKDVAADIAYALHKIEVEEDRSRKESALREARDKLERRIKERTQELEMVSTKLLNAQEEERKRIASDLHDGIGQCLSAVKFIVETALEQMNGKIDETDLKSLKALVPLLQETSEEVRTIVMNLRPSILDDLGVLATIGWFCRQFQAVYGFIRIIETIDITEDQIPDSLKTIIFRILQESMNNIAKHSRADEVRVHLRRTGNFLELWITDNGRGFDITSESFRGFGITGMRERTELSGGKFSLSSAPGAGTTVKARWAYTCIRSIS